MITKLIARQLGLSSLQASRRMLLHSRSLRPLVSDIINTKQNQKHHERQSLTSPFIKEFSTSCARANKTSNAFVDVITEDLASKSPQLVTLHNRLSLPHSFKLSTLARCLTCIKKDNKYPNNKGLNIFGKNLLSYHTHEYFLVKYPRLPLNVLNAAIDGTISERVLYSVGKSWGIEIDNTSALEKYLNEEPEEFSIGKLRFDSKEEELERNLKQIKGSSKLLTKETAMASAVKSIIGGYYASTKSLAETKQFIYDYILLSRDLKVQEMFKFEQPTRELSVLCKREGLEQPVSRLLAETGRASKRPVFVVGVFSGQEKLGESYGASLKEAKTRASVNALKNWYLYSPVEASFPSDANYKSGVVDHGVVIV